MAAKKIILTEEQTAWLKEVYPNTHNDIISLELGMSKRTLFRFVHEYGLRKSAEYQSRYRYHVGRRMDTKEEKERVKHISDTRRKLYKKERARVLFGLPQRTELRVIPQSRKHISLRFRLRKRGYLIDDAKGIAYYDEYTKRSFLMESREQPWYVFLCLDATEKSVT